MRSNKSKLQENSTTNEMTFDAEANNKIEIIRSLLSATTMESNKSKLQKNSTTNEMTFDAEANNKIEIIRPLLDCDEINFSDYSCRTLTQVDIESILSRCGMILHKLILCDKICDSIIMATVKKYCQNLENFQFCLSKKNEDDFTDVFTNMTKLKSLTVRSNSLFRRNEGKPLDISKVLNSVQDDINEIFLLTHVATKSFNHYVNCFHIFPSTLGRFKNLRHLILEDYDIDNNAVKEISKITSLIKLEFLSCRIKEDTLFIFKHFISSIVNINQPINNLILNLPKLESLTFKFMQNIDCIINLSDESKNLKYLNIYHCDSVSSDSLKKISNLINLEELCLEGCENFDGDVFSSIVNGCKKLKNLVVPRCQMIPENALVNISNLKNLEVLDIRENENLNDNFFIIIGNTCKKIRELYIYSCNNISNLALNELAKLENLEVLALGDVSNAGDEMFKNMYKLKSLMCTWCNNVTDTGIIRIIRNSSNLEYLMICHTGITSKTLVYAADETKKRTNNIVLKITTNKRVIEDYFKLQHDSGFSGKFIDMQIYDMCCKRC